MSEIESLKKDIKTLFTLYQEIRNEIEDLKIQLEEDIEEIKNEIDNLKLQNEGHYAEIGNIYEILERIKQRLYFLEEKI